MICMSMASNLIEVLIVTFDVFQGKFITTPRRWYLYEQDIGVLAQMPKNQVSMFTTLQNSSSQQAKDFGILERRSIVWFSFKMGSFSRQVAYHRCMIGVPVIVQEFCLTFIYLKDVGNEPFSKCHVTEIEGVSGLLRRKHV